MKRFLTALVLGLAAIFAVTGCNDYGNTFQANTGAQITTLSPSNIAAGSAAFTLTINGSGFVTQTYITWNNTKLVTSDITDSSGDVLQVYATVPASLVANSGQALIITHNPFSGAGNNGLSNPLNFIINPTVAANPQPLVATLSPGSANANGPAFTLTITGANFLLGANPTTVTWTAAYPSAPSGLPSSCTAVTGATNTVQCSLTVTSAPSATQIQATVPAALLTVAAAACSSTQQNPTVAVSVTNPANSAGGGGPSNAIAFTLNPPACTNPAVVKAQAAAEETPALSADGRYVAYTGSQGQNTAVFYRDTCAGAPSACQERTSLVAVAADGLPANDDSHTPSMSADGRYVAFSSAATNLLSSGAAAGVSAGPGRQIYLRDTCTGAATTCVPSTELVSTDSSGQLVGTEAILPSVSASGRFVAFVAITASKAPSSASGVPATNSGYSQIFIRDTCLGATNCTAKTTRISLQPGDATAGATSSSGPPGPAPAGPALSGDAKSIALTGGGTAVLFTRSLAVDDRVFVAAVGQSR